MTSKPVKLPQELIDLMDEDRGVDTPGNHLHRVYREWLELRTVAREITHPDLVRGKGVARALKDLITDTQKEIERLKSDVAGLQHVTEGMKYLLTKEKKK